MTRRWRQLVLGVGIGLVAGGVATAVVLAVDPGSRPTVATQPSGPYRGSEPPPGIELPQFSLPTVRGNTITTRDLRGRVVLTTFVDSACMESCPIIIGILGDALRRLSRHERARVAALAISVDPTVDTPAHVRRFLAERGALGEVEYLVDTIPRMRPVWRKFRIVSAVETGDADVHSADVRVFDRRGAWVSTLHAGVDLTPRNLVHDVRVALGPT